MEMRWKKWGGGYVEGLEVDYKGGYVYVKMEGGCVEKIMNCYKIER